MDDGVEEGSKGKICPSRVRGVAFASGPGAAAQSGEGREEREALSRRSLYLPHRGIVLYVLYTTQQKGRARAGTVALEGNGQTYGLPQVVMDYCAGWVPRLSLGGVVVGAEPDRDGYDRRGRARTNRGTPRTGRSLRWQS